MPLPYTWLQGTHTPQRTYPLQGSVSILFKRRPHASSFYSTVTDRNSGTRFYQTFPRKRTLAAPGFDPVSLDFAVKRVNHSATPCPPNVSLCEIKCCRVSALPGRYKNEVFSYVLKLSISLRLNSKSFDVISMYFNQSDIVKSDQVRKRNCIFSKMCKALKMLDCATARK